MSKDMFDKQFEETVQKVAPLATRMRPTSLATFVGQEHILGNGKVLRKAIDAGKTPSMILWGPPGCGKTTLAFIISNTAGAHFVALSAVSASVADLRRVIEDAKQRLGLHLQKTILFIDEIHRFNKAQQDAVLPYVEDGTITLIGATTENPSFEVTSPLLSRTRVIPMKPLSPAELQTLINRALKDTLHGVGDLRADIDEDALGQLITLSNSDARIALNTLEIAAQNTNPSDDGRRHIKLETIEDALQKRTILYDRAGDQHYDLISALHKSLRGSDPDAGLYWLAKMLEAGEDPLFIVRRLIRFASEDVGMADPQALVIAMAAQQAVHFVGMPEANLALAQVVVYLATAPKSNSLYEAYSKAQNDVKKGPVTEVPLHLRNPVTGMMKDMGYGKDYKYAHNYPGHFVEQQNMPDQLQGKKYYTPGEIGYEKQVLARLKAWWDRNTKPIVPPPGKQKPPEEKPHDEAES